MRLVNCLKQGKKITKSILQNTPPEIIRQFQKRLVMYDRGDKRLSVAKLIGDIKKFAIKKQRAGAGDAENMATDTYIIINTTKRLGEGAWGAVYRVTSTLRGEKMTIGGTDYVVKVFHETTDSERINNVKECIDRFRSNFPDIRTTFLEVEQESTKSIWVCKSALADHSGTFNETSLNRICSGTEDQIIGYTMTKLEGSLDTFTTLEELKLLNDKLANTTELINAFIIPNNPPSIPNQTMRFLHGDIKLENILCDSANTLYLHDLDTVMCYPSNIYISTFSYDKPIDHTTIYSHPLFIAMSCMVFPTNKLSFPGMNPYELWKMECNIACHSTNVTIGNKVFAVLDTIHGVLYKNIAIQRFGVICDSLSDDEYIHAVFAKLFTDDESFNATREQILKNSMEYFDLYSLGVSLLFHAIKCFYTEKENEKEIKGKAVELRKKALSIIEQSITAPFESLNPSSGGAKNNKKLKKGGTQTLALTYPNMQLYEGCKRTDMSIANNIDLETSINNIFNTNEKPYEFFKSLNALSKVKMCYQPSSKVSTDGSRVFKITYNTTNNKYEFDLIKQL